VSSRLDPDERARLESERDFLLRSLDDLDSERAAGNVDEASYAALHDDYTARAAAAIRALRDGVDARAPAPPVSSRRRAIVVGAIVAFALTAGVALAAALGARLPGQTASGNTPREQPETPAARRAALEQTVAEHPDDVAARLALARFLEGDDDLFGALRQYDEVLRLEPANPDALAQSGRILYLAAERARGPDEAQDLIGASRARLDQAVAADPEYADARFFRAVLVVNAFGDLDRSEADLQRYLVLAPDGQYARQARRLLADIAVARTQPSTTAT
jgi:cytochrome c-type biogenesis protein CcmH/NrfG